MSKNRFSPEAFRELVSQNSNVPPDSVVIDQESNQWFVMDSGARHRMTQAAKSIVGAEPRRGVCGADFFERYYLPFFLGIPTDNGACLKDWIQIAGGIFHEVYLINNKDEVVAIVPAVTSNRIYKTNENKTVKTGGDVITEIEKLRTVRPQEAKDLNEEYLAFKLGETDTQALEDEQRKWYELFDYFNGFELLNEYRKEQGLKEISTDHGGTKTISSPTNALDQLGLDDDDAWG